MPTVNGTIEVTDRFWDADLKPEPGYRYKVGRSRAWFPESQIKTHVEVQEILAVERYCAQDDPDLQAEDWVYDEYGRC